MSINMIDFVIKYIEMVILSHLILQSILCDFFKPVIWVDLFAKWMLSTFDIFCVIFWNVHTIDTSYNIYPLTLCLPGDVAVISNV